MNDSVLTALGIKVSTLIAGFAGATVSLAFNEKLTRWQAISSLVVGLLTANYMTDAVMQKAGIAADLRNGTAFMIGMVAMSAIPLAKKTILATFKRWSSASDQPTQGEGDAK